MADTTHTAPQASVAALTTPSVEATSHTSTPRTAGGTTAAASATKLLRPSSPRKRRRTPEDTVLPDAGAQSPVSPKTLITVPQPLTGAGEMLEKQQESKRRRFAAEEEASQQISENPSAKAVSTLLGLTQNISRPEDAPDAAANKLSEPVAAIAPELTAKSDESRDALTSPVSTTSASTADAATSLLANAPPAQVSSPGQMAEDNDRGGRGENNHINRSHTVDSFGAKSFTYPGPLLSAQLDGGKRNLSLDSGMPRDDTKSPGSNKKHKCPYCSTEFTRHHNLKSHLLTHSHEKPYLCQECDSRFRRLHDLKRHMKLHTGERPHVCSKCHRSFARGDALARHNKGQGGCAGRRSSAGSYGGDGGEGSEEAMEGMIYTMGDASQEPDHMDEDNDQPAERGSNVPSIRHHDAPQQASRSETQTLERQPPPTYLPATARAPPLGGSLYPPNAPHGGSSGPQSPSIASSGQGSYPPPAYGVAAPYGQHPMTESPKPLSPGHGAPPPNSTRNRAPSLSQSLTANAFVRRQSTRTDTTLPPPPTHSTAPTLPPPPGMTLGPPDPRYSASTSVNAQPGSGSSYAPPGGSFPGPGSAGSVHNSNSNSLSSHGTGQPVSGERATLPYAADDRVWAFVKSLEAKIERLETEMASLKQQLAHYQQTQPSPVMQPQIR